MKRLTIYAIWVEWSPFHWKLVIRPYGVVLGEVKETIHQGKWFVRMGQHEFIKSFSSLESGQRAVERELQRRPE